MSISEILKEQILILDGAMGTMIQRNNLKEEDYRGQRFASHTYDLKGFNDILVLTKPEIISRIHKEYLSAGANIIETNTFNAQSISLSDYGLEEYAYEINLEATRLARAVADEFLERDHTQCRFVAGAIGPTNSAASLSPNLNNTTFRSITFAELVKAYTEQVEGLMDGKADLLLVETIFDALNAKAALCAITKVFEKKGSSIPIMVSATVSDASGRILSGQTLDAFLLAVSYFPILSIGINCSFGASGMKPFIELLAAKAPYFTSIYANAGLPSQLGEYDEKAEQMADVIETYMSNGLINIVGGCCGTTPEHIELLAEKAKKYKPRTIPPADHIAQL